VHAEGQVASIHLQREMTPVKLRNAINGNLARDLRVLSVEIAPEDFHARHSAIGKTYVYRLVHGPVMSPFWSRFAHQEARPMDLEQMRESARLFIGEHDWTAFSAAQADAESRVRSITDLVISAGWDGRGHCHLIEIAVTANGFLRYMVRSIVGTLLAAGRGEIEADIIQRAIREGDRNLVGATAPACGLTLLRVQYD
jgi:tRNA pseudouridine38-40 synthase